MELVKAWFLSQILHCLFKILIQICVIFLDCECGSTGSNSTNCDTDGKCTCILGYIGDKCEPCVSGYYQDISGICRGIIFKCPFFN